MKWTILALVILLAGIILGTILLFHQPGGAVQP